MHQPDQPGLDDIRNEASESEGEYPKRATDLYAVVHAANGIALVTHADAR